MSVSTFGTDSTYYPITPSTSPRGFFSNALLASCQEPVDVSPPCRCQVSQTKNQLLTPQSSSGSLSEVKAKSNIESETHAGKFQYMVDRVLRAVQGGPNGIVEICNATPAVYDVLMQALDGVKGISLHYDAVSSKIIVYGPPSIVHNDTAAGMISLAKTASEELRRIYSIPNMAHFASSRLIQLQDDDETVDRVPDSSFSIRMEDEGSGEAHTVIIEVAYTRTYRDTVNSLHALLCVLKEIRLGILIKIQRPGNPNWRKATEWEELKDWKVWIQLFTM